MSELGGEIGDIYLFGAAAEAGNDFSFHFVGVGRFGAGLRADDVGAGRHGDVDG